MTKKEKKIYPYCENGLIPSEEVVAKFSKPNRIVVDPRTDVKSDYEAEYNSPQESMYAELEGYYRAYGDWTIAYACMNMD